MHPDNETTDLRLASLTTEARNPDSMSIDTLSALEIVELMNTEDATVAAAVRSQAGVIADVIDILADRLARGGRLIYMGAGTSGRLGVLDATECPPTFNTRPEQVVGLIAGGRDALVRAVEGAEDHPEFGVADLEAIHMSESDVVVGIATSGRTPYVVGGLEFARLRGAVAVGLTCNRDSALEAVADYMIVPVVGPEVISGSTRLKAGTATKLVLNMLTTGAMVRLGKTYGNLMVDLRATNQKLTDRSRRIVAMITGVDDLEASSLLRSAAGELKTAIVMKQASATAEDARHHLDACHGHLRTAVQQIKSDNDHRHRTASYLLGVDGGGSKTVAWLVPAGVRPGGVCPGGVRTDSVVPVGRGESGPANPRSVGLPRARNNIARAIAAAFDDAHIAPHAVAALGLAIAGAGQIELRQRLSAWATNLGLAERVSVTTDADAVFDAVSDRGAMIVLIAGTGSICLGRDAQGTIHRSGGWGYLIGDEGSGYAIGLTALRACARAFDRRQEDAGSLCAAIQQELNVDSFESLHGEIQSHLADDRRALAKLAMVVQGLAEQGDVASLSIVERAAEDLAEMVAVVARSLDERSPTIALAGGLFVGSESYRERVQRAIERRIGSVRAWHLVEHPVVGAVHHAQRLIAS